MTTLETATIEQPTENPAPHANKEAAKEPGQVSPWAIHRRLYDWVLHWAETPYALPALICLSLLESSIFPIPPDVLLIALVAGSLQKWWKFAAWCTVASVIGGIIGYGIGAFFWELAGQWILETIVGIELVDVDGRQDIALPGYMTKTFGESLGGEYLFQVYDKWNAWIVFVFGLTPLPYKLVTISAGVARIDFGIFILASIVARATRFFAVAAILRVFGERALAIIDRYFNIVVILFTVLLIGSYVLVSWALK